MKLAISTASFAIIAGALAACSSADVSGPGSASSVASSGTGSSASTAALARIDRSFVDQAAQNGWAEVESSKLALSKSSNPQVKTFAQRMIDDHTRVNQQLASLAQSKGVTPSTTPSLAQRAQMQSLAAAAGPSFDSRYVETMGIAAHEQTIKLFEAEAASSTDAELKGFATSTLPALQHHLDMARALNSAMAQ